MGIVLAVCGAGLYFMRSFKPALARDYDVFFAAIGLLCGGILFFQGWRLDPILQFGQFLLAGTTVFFAYESVRLRGIATDQARRSSYFDDEQPPARMPSGGLAGGWDDSYDQFEESPISRRRFVSRENEADSSQEEDFYSAKRTSRAAIPEQAASRRGRNNIEDSSWDQNRERARRMARFGNDDEANTRSSFGERRSVRQDQRRGTRPLAKDQTTARRRTNDNDSVRPVRNTASRSRYPSSRDPEAPRLKKSPLDSQPEDAAFSPARPRSSSKSLRTPSSESQASSRPSSDSSMRNRNSSKRNPRPRDNSSRFDD